MEEGEISHESEEDSIIPDFDGPMEGYDDGPWSDEEEDHGQRTIIQLEPIEEVDDGPWYEEHHDYTGVTEEKDDTPASRDNKVNFNNPVEQHFSLKRGSAPDRKATQKSNDAARHQQTPAQNSKNDPKIGGIFEMMERQAGVEEGTGAPANESVSKNLRDGHFR